MNTKKRLFISLIVVAILLLSIITTVIIFAAAQQTISTTLNITYKVEDIDGTASASYTIGGITEKLTAKKGTNVIGETLVFKAGDRENAGNLMFPKDALALTSQNDNVVIQYTYSNTGAKHYIASMDLNANIKKDNMKVEYSINGTEYSEQPYAVVVPANTSNRSYWIKISILDKAKSASFTGDFDWLLKGCNPQTEDYLSIISSEFQATVEGAYAVKLNGEGYLPGGKVVFPSEINGDKVTTIVQNTSLTDAQKAQVTSVYIPDSVQTIGDGAFSGFVNLESVIFEQNEGSATSGLTTIGANAFAKCASLTSIEIPNSVTNIGTFAFSDCTKLTSVTFKNTENWFVADSSDATSGTDLSSADLSNTSTAATDLKSTYVDKYWKRG